MANLSVVHKSEAKWTYVGIDVSKDFLDVASEQSAQQKRYGNHPRGRQALCKQLGQLCSPWVVLEATGGYQDDVVDALHEQGIQVCVVNPRQVRDFAKATGRLAKTDTLDAQVILHFAKAVQPQPTTPDSKQVRALRALTRRRDQLVKMKTDELKRKAQCRDAATAQTIDAHIDWLDNAIDELELEIQNALKSDEPGSRNASTTLTSVPGVGPVVSSVLLAELPQLGKLDNKKLCALVGLAPYNHDSGKLKGKRHIRGGKSFARTALFLAALVASRHNPTLAAFYKRLIDQKKPKKLALIATARKLLCILNSMMKNQQYWICANV